MISCPHKICPPHVATSHKCYTVKPINFCLLKHYNIISFADLYCMFIVNMIVSLCIIVRFVHLSNIWISFLLLCNVCCTVLVRIVLIFCCFYLLFTMQAYLFIHLTQHPLHCMSSCQEWVFFVDFVFEKLSSFRQKNIHRKSQNIPLQNQPISWRWIKKAIPFV
jgi:hypothetical protein